MKHLILVCVLATAASVMSAQSGTIVVQNMSAVAVTETYISPNSATTWGPNLGGVAANSSASFPVTGGDSYDLGVLFANGDTMTIENFWVGSGATVTQKVCIFADNCEDGGGGGGGGGNDKGCSTGDSSSHSTGLAALISLLVLLARASWLRPSNHPRYTR
jgi:hypothetical protein